jgi:hypothetical protein
MFAWHRVEVDVPFARVCDVLRGDPAGWIPSLSEDPSGRLICTISVNFGGHLQRRAQLGIGAVESGEGWATVPVSWRAADADVLFPTFAGELQAALLPEERCELAMLGSYQPPLGAVGELVDRLVLHRVAGQALSRFLERTAGQVANCSLAVTAVQGAIRP